MTYARLDITDESKRHIAADAKRADRVVEVLQQGLMRIGQTMAGHVKNAYFTGYVDGVGRAQKRSMIFNRSTTLRNDIDSQPVPGAKLGVLVGVPSGSPSARYAAAILGGGVTEIEPVQADFLTIPMRDNLNASGQAKQDAREAIDSGGWFYRPDDSPSQLFIVKRRGKTTKSKLLFLFHLVRRVEIQGTDALMLGMRDKVDEAIRILQGGVSQLYREGAL